jgi:hypothetical protein
MFMQPLIAPSISATAPYRLMARSPCSPFSPDGLTIYSARLQPELSTNPEQLSMSQKLAYLLPLLAAVPLFLLGALRRQGNEVTADFIPQKATLAADLGVSANDGAGLIAAAAARLGPDQVQWLHTTLWQRQAVSAVPFESEGSLQLGPNQCVRLDLTTRSGSVSARRLVVCDGQAVARLVQVGRSAPVVRTDLLVPEETSEAASQPPKPALPALGQGGPGSLLKRLGAELRDISTQTGLLQGHAVVRVGGRLEHSAVSAAVTTDIPADFCYLYFDTQSLWPRRLEWWSSDSKGSRRIVSELEYRDPQLNRPLSVSECVRAFSYHPGSGADPAK